MAKFEGDFKAYDTVNERGYERLFVSPDITAKCVVCKEPTHWCNVAFGAPICSHECQDKLWTEYFNRVAAEVEEIRALEAQGFDPETVLGAKLAQLSGETEGMDIDAQFSGDDGALADSPVGLERPVILIGERKDTIH